MQDHNYNTNQICLSINWVNFAKKSNCKAFSKTIYIFDNKFIGQGRPSVVAAVVC